MFYSDLAALSPRLAVQWSKTMSGRLWQSLTCKLQTCTSLPLHAGILDLSVCVTRVRQKQVLSSLLGCTIHQFDLGSALKETSAVQSRGLQQM